MIKKLTIPILSAALLFGAGTLGASAMLNQTATAELNSDATPLEQDTESIFWAMHSNDPNFREQLDTFIKNGGDITATDKYGNTLLHYAVYDGDTAITQIFLDKITEEKVPQILSIQDKYGKTLLHYAVYDRNTAITQILLKKIPTDNVQILDITDNYGWTPLLWIVSEAYTYMNKNNAKKFQKCVEIVDLLIEKGANPIITSRNGTSALVSTENDPDTNVKRILLQDLQLQNLQLQGPQPGNPLFTSQN